MDYAIERKLEKNTQKFANRTGMMSCLILFWLKYTYQILLIAHQGHRDKLEKKVK